MTLAHSVSETAKSFFVSLPSLSLTIRRTKSKSLSCLPKISRAVGSFIFGLAGAAGSVFGSSTLALSLDSSFFDSFSLSLGSSFLASLFFNSSFFASLSLASSFFASLSFDSAFFSSFFSSGMMPPT